MYRPCHVILTAFIVTLSAVVSFQRTCAQTAREGQIERSVDSLIALMTLEEKVGQLTQYRGRWSDTGPKVAEGGEEQIRNGSVGSFLGVYGSAYTRDMQKLAVEHSRLRIPLLFAYDVIHGLRTITPIPLAEASSWDPELVERSARMAAVEATAYGLHWTFAPMVDIARDPRWGRIAEGSGEDPYLGSAMAVARVRGFQGSDLTSPTTMLACAKHFTAYGGAEGGRDYNTVDISEHTLREVYLPPFRAAVDAGVQTLMASFNEVSGVPMHANGRLINGVLRGEWGFDGLVVSDYTGIMELLSHGIGATPGDVGAAAINAGVDVDMVAEIYLKDVPARVRSGDVKMAVVDEAVRRVLRAKYRLGLFEDPYRYNDAKREQADVLTPEHRALAREMARSSIVLLKNESKTLPLSKEGKSVAVIGSLAVDSATCLGTWAGLGRAEDVITVLEGVRRAVSPRTSVRYAAGAYPGSNDTNEISVAVEMARTSDAVILVVGETRNMSGEASNRSSLDLPGAQQELVDQVLSLGKPTVVVVMSGRPLSISKLAEQAPAILQAWHLGVEMGNATADVLFGDHNPSGKLPVTIPRTVGQVPLYYNHKTTGRPPDEKQHYTSKYLDVHWTPLYPFGHGLSFTTFSYGVVKLSSETMKTGDQMTVTVDVRNEGDRDGHEVVQLYVKDEVGSLTRPVKELKRFAKILLRKGERKNVSFTLTEKDLSFLGPDLKPVTESGFFTVFVGGSSENTNVARFKYVK